MTAQQLKNSILQLAVQGKLVPQNPDDVPASVLLERIKAEKQSLIRAGKIKKDKYKPDVIKPEDVPFEIPESWEWVRFSNLVHFSMGKTPPRKDSQYWNNPVFPWVSIADMPSDRKLMSTKEKVNQYSVDTLFKSGISPAGTLIMSFKLTVGKVSILGIDAYHNEAIISIFPYVDDNKITTSFLFRVLPLISQSGDTKTAIKGATLNSDSLSNLLIPLPPLAEQKRIVEKIEELLPYIDAYNKAESQLTALNKSFPEMLKKSILQEAVQGRLVPQNPDDVPASVLLERIKVEKQALIRAGKIKKDKYKPDVIKPEEIPFEIPDSWEWCRLGTIFQHNTGKALNSSNRQGIKMTYITTSNLYWDKFELNNLKEMLFTESELEKCTVLKGDLLVCEGGDTGRASIWNYDYPMRIQNHIHKLRPYSPIVTYFFYYVFYLYKRTGLINGRGIGIKGLSSNTLDNLLIPLPPIEEQQRIVEKIEELIKYCDML